MVTFDIPVAINYYSGFKNVLMLFVLLPTIENSVSLLMLEMSWGNLVNGKGVRWKEILPAWFLHSKFHSLKSFFVALLLSAACLSAEIMIDFGSDASTEKIIGSRSLAGPAEMNQLNDTAIRADIDYYNTVSRSNLKIVDENEYGMNICQDWSYLPSDLYSGKTEYDGSLNFGSNVLATESTDHNFTISAVGNRRRAMTANGTTDTVEFLDEPSEIRTRMCEPDLTNAYSGASGVFGESVAAPNRSGLYDVQPKFVMGLRLFHADLKVAQNGSVACYEPNAENITTCIEIYEKEVFLFYAIRKHQLYRVVDVIRIPQGKIREVDLSRILVGIIKQGEIFKSSKETQSSVSSNWMNKREALYYLAAWSMFGLPNRGTATEFRVVTHERNVTRLNKYFIAGSSLLCSVYLAVLFLRFTLLFLRLREPKFWKRKVSVLELWTFPIKPMAEKSYRFTIRANLSDMMDMWLSVKNNGVKSAEKRTKAKIGLVNNGLYQELTVTDKPVPATT